MSVPRRILTVLIRSITILETGDRKVPEAQNSLNALLIYPVPGTPEVFATSGLIGIEDGKLTRFSPPMRPADVLAGYVSQYDGKIDLNCPTPALPSTWGKIKSSYRD